MWMPFKAKRKLRQEIEKQVVIMKVEVYLLYIC
jgi:hypothetical protein